MKGKQLEPRTPQEERAHQQRKNLLTAIGKLASLGKEFERPEYWEGRETRKAVQATGEPRYYTFDELFARQSEGHKPGTRASFARRKVEALEQRLKEVRELASPDHYEGHPAYKLAEQYISYLLSIKDESNQPTASPTTRTSLNERKRPGCPATNIPFTAFFDDVQKRKKVLAVLKQHHEAGEAAPAARIIQAAQSLGYFPNNVKAAPLHRALSKELEGLGSVEAFRRVFNRANDPSEIARYKAEIENAQP